MAKTDKLVALIKTEVDREFEEGRTTSVGDDELELIISPGGQRRLHRACATIAQNWLLNK